VFIHHHFTVDVEEYFQVAAMEPYVDRRAWSLIDARIDVDGEFLELAALDVAAPDLEEPFCR
jgi:hypothetical protein